MNESKIRWRKVDVLIAWLACLYVMSLFLGQKTEHLGTLAVSPAVTGHRFRIDWLQPFEQLLPMNTRKQTNTNTRTRTHRDTRFDVIWSNYRIFLMYSEPTVERNVFGIFVFLNFHLFPSLAPCPAWAGSAIEGPFQNRWLRSSRGRIIFFAT